MKKSTVLNTPERFIELDALRGIAVMLVLLSHYTFAYDYYFKILDQHLFHFPYGVFGVQIFFMISGFVIFMTIEVSDSLKSFAISRFSRLYPTYWMSIALTLSIIALFPIPTLGNYSFIDIVINLTMLQGFFKIPHIDGVYWTLGIELLFYTIIGILYITQQLKRIELVSLFWLLLVVIGLSFDFRFEKYIRVLAILDFAPLFIAGMMFYKIKYKTTNYVNHLIIIMSLIIYIFSLYIQLIKQPQIEMNLIPFIFISLVYSFFYFLIYFDLKFLRNKYLLFLGYISYPLYLLHNMIGFSIIYRLKSVYNNQLFYVSITMFVTIILAYFVTKYMEQPSKLIKNTLNKRFKCFNYVQAGLK